MSIYHFMVQMMLNVYAIILTEIMIYFLDYAKKEIVGVKYLILNLLLIAENDMILIKLLLIQKKKVSKMENLWKLDGLENH